MKFKNTINYTIIMILIILLKNDFTKKYVIFLYLAFFAFYFITLLVEIYILFNHYKFSNVKNNYVTKKIIYLNSEVSEIKNNKLDYVFKSERGYMFMGILLFFIETIIYKNDLNIAIRITTYILLIISTYKVLSICMYNEVMRINNTLKFIAYNAERNLIKKEETLYIVSKFKLFIIIIIILSMIIKMI